MDGLGIGLVGFFLICAIIVGILQLVEFMCDIFKRIFKIREYEPKRTNRKRIYYTFNEKDNMKVYYGMQDGDVFFIYRENKEPKEDKSLFTFCIYKVVGKNKIKREKIERWEWVGYKEYNSFEYLIKNSTIIN